MLFPPADTFKTTDKGHGRIEERTICVLSIAPGQVSFPFANQIFSIYRLFTPTNGDEPSSELVYGITSLAAKNATPERLLECNRCHWTIENKVHYVRDVTMAEDQSRIRKGNGPRVFATIRNIVLNLFRNAGITNIAEALQKFSYSRRALLAFAGIYHYAAQ